MNINYLIERLGTYKTGKDRGLRVSGCGMDMGFSVVYNTGMQVYPTKEEAQKCKIMNYRNGSKEYETSGGYVLKQRWLERC